jgi:hypothetical protein
VRGICTAVMLKRGMEPAPDRAEKR